MNEGKIVTHTAVVGRYLTMPGAHPVRTSRPPGSVLLRLDRWSEFELVPGPINRQAIDVSDCSVYTIQHDVPDVGSGTREDLASRLLEQALDAISEAHLWFKAADAAQATTPFLRQVGRADVKAFIVPFLADAQCLLWYNPIHALANRTQDHIMSAFFGGVTVVNSPTREQMHHVLRRVLSSLDLVNLGFYTEAFVNIFAVVDDVTQQVLRAALKRRGLEAKEQEEFLRSVKETRLRLFLTTVMKTVGGRSLEDDEPALFKRLLVANSLRNRIMHGSERLQRAECIDACNSLLSVLRWLRKNPFDLAFPVAPQMRLAVESFTLLELPAASAPSAPAEPSTSGPEEAK